MSLELGLLPGHLLSIIKTAPLRYKVFSIDKKSGGKRVIAQPAREVKSIQRWLVNDLSFLPVHDAVTSYRKGESIKSNAERHKEGNYLLKMDFKNFFPSIKAVDLVGFFSESASKKYSEIEIKIIVRAVTWAPLRTGELQLCIGAPSSPFLSNAILHQFDCVVAEKTSEMGIIYSRYADDLAFSTRSPNLLEAIPALVQGELEKLKFPRIIINSKKTIHASRSTRRTITGLNLTPERELSVGRERKRKVRAMFDHYKRGLLDNDEIEELMGLLAFIDHIEPGFSDRLKAGYQ